MCIRVVSAGPNGVQERMGALVAGFTGPCHPGRARAAVGRWGAGRRGGCSGAENGTPSPVDKSRIFSAADNLVFVNAGGAPNAVGGALVGCTAPTLPAGLSVGLALTKTSRAITGIAPAVTPSNVTIAVAVAAVNGIGSSSTTVILAILDGTAVLTLPTDLPTLTLVRTSPMTFLYFGVALV